MQVKDKIDLRSGELRCPRCFGKDLVPSQPRGLLDRLMSCLDRVPRHCRFCEKRFYVPRAVLRDMDRALAEARFAAYREAAANRQVSGRPGGLPPAGDCQKSLADAPGPAESAS